MKLEQKFGVGWIRTSVVGVPLTVWLWSILFLAVICLGVMGFRYGNADDFLYARLASQQPMLAHDSAFVRDGRPMLFILIKSIMPYFHTIADLAWVRLISVIGLLGFGVIVHGFAKSLYLHPALVLLFMALGLCNPAIGALVTYALTFPYLWVGALAFAAGWWLVKSPHTTIIESLGYILVLLLVLTTYQSQVSFFIIPVALMLLRTPENKSLLRSGVIALLILGISLVSYRGLTLWLGYVVTGDQTEMLRGTLDMDVMTKIGRIYQAAFQTTLAGWSGIIHPAMRAPVAYGVLGLFLCGLASVTYHTRRSSLVLRAMVILISLTLAYLPLWVVRSSYVPFRILQPAYLLTGGFTVIAIQWLIESHCLSIPPAVKRSSVLLATLVAFFILAYGSHTVYRGIIRPNVNELKKLVAYFDAKYSKRPDRVIYFPRRAAGAEERGVARHEEYGSLTSDSHWAAEGIISLLANEKFGFHKEDPAILVEYTPHRLIPDSLKSYLFDTSEAVSSGLSREAFDPNNYDDPILGHVTYQGSGDGYDTEWLGTLYNKHFPYLYSQKLGWILIIAGDNDTVWIRTISQTFSTNRKVFPLILERGATEWKPYQEVLRAH